MLAMIRREDPREPTAQMILVEGMETFGVQCDFANTLRKFVDLRFPMYYTFLQVSTRTTYNVALYSTLPALTGHFIL
jgi:hypothetical protein